MLFLNLLLRSPHYRIFLSARWFMSTDPVKVTRRGTIASAVKGVKFRRPARDWWHPKPTAKSVPSAIPILDCIAGVIVTGIRSVHRGVNATGSKNYFIEWHFLLSSLWCEISHCTWDLSLSFNFSGDTLKQAILQSW